jgi:hypothetical protein
MFVRDYQRLPETRVIGTDIRIVSRRRCSAVLALDAEFETDSLLSDAGTWTSLGAVIQGQATPLSTVRVHRRGAADLPVTYRRLRDALVLSHPSVFFASSVQAAAV